MHLDIDNPAGFWNRLGARVIDVIVIIILTGPIVLILHGDFWYSERSWVDIFGYLYGIILPLIWSGYTIGRRLVGNRIVKLDGSQVDVLNMLLREILASLFYVLTLGVGLIISAFMIGLREDKRAIHDFIARTYVTHNRPEE